MTIGNQFHLIARNVRIIAFDKKCTESTAKRLARLLSTCMEYLHFKRFHFKDTAKVLYKRTKTKCKRQAITLSLLE